MFKLEGEVGTDHSGQAVTATELDSDNLPDVSMRSTNMFREQVNTVTNWFKLWSECEQTVALYSLLKRIKPIQGKFLAQVLVQSASEDPDMASLETEANDSEYIGHLCNESIEKAITDLLTHMPLLRAGNEVAKVEYLNIIPKVLSHSIEKGVYIEESRQLLSYSLIHPAITSDERAKFTMWLGYLEERFTYSIYHQSAQIHCNNIKDLPGYCPSKDNGYGTSTTSVLTNGSTVPGQQQHPVITTVPPCNGWRDSTDNIIDTHRLADLVLNGGSRSTSNLSSHHGSHSTINGAPEHIPLHRTRGGGGHIPLHATSSAPSQFRSPPPSTPLTNNSQPNPHPQLRHTLSVSPMMHQPLSNVSDWLHSNDNQFVRPRMSLQSDHAPLSPQSSTTSSGSGSDSHHDDGPQPVRNSFLEEHTGMRDVPIWLKSLRLHKYSYLFQQLAYEDMLEITEHWLESQNVTKGARHKIVVNINKLKERQQVLRNLEKDILDDGCIKSAVSEMKNMLNSPIKQFSLSNSNHGNAPGCAGDASMVKSPMAISPSSPSVSEGESTSVVEGDLPSQFTRLMGKVCTQMLVSNRTDDECFGSYLSLIDKCINHEAFSPKQKKLLSSWKQQAQKIWHPSQLKYSLDPSKRKSWGNTFPIGMANRGSPGRQGRPPKPCMTQWSFGSRRSIVGGTTSGHSLLSRNHSLNPAMFTRPGLFEGKQAVTRTQSAPLHSSQIVPQRIELGPSDTEINARLDSLCLSMTEHALGIQDSTDRNSTF